MSKKTLAMAGKKPKGQFSKNKPSPQKVAAPPSGIVRQVQIPAEVVDDLIRQQHPPRLAKFLFQSLAERLSSDLAPPDLALTFLFTKQLEKNVGDINDIAKHKVAELLKEKGHRVPDTKGAVELQAGGYILSAHPQKTGYDDKKVEALLRAKGIHPESGMDATVVYKTNEAKLAEILKRWSDKLTQDELNTCKHDPSKLSIMSPKPVEGAKSNE